MIIGAWSGAPGACRQVGLVVGASVVVVGVDAAATDEGHPPACLFAIDFQRNSGVFLPGTIETATEAETVAEEVSEHLVQKLAQVPDGLFEAASEAIVHPNVNQRVGYSVTHGQVVRDEPDVHNVRVFPDLWRDVADDNQRVEW